MASLANHFCGPILVDRKGAGGGLEGAPQVLRLAHAGFRTFVSDFGDLQDTVANAAPAGHAWDILDIGSPSGDAFTVGPGDGFNGGVVGIIDSGTTTATGLSLFGGNMGILVTPSVAAIAKHSQWFSARVAVRDVSTGFSWFGLTVSGISPLGVAGAAAVTNGPGFHINAAGLISAALGNTLTSTGVSVADDEAVGLVFHFKPRAITTGSATVYTCDFYVNDVQTNTLTESTDSSVGAQSAPTMTALNVGGSANFVEVAHIAAAITVPQT